MLCGFVLGADCGGFCLLSFKPVTQEAPQTFPAVTGDTVLVCAPLMAGVVVGLSRGGKDREAGVAGA